jgi:hypothetical protein
MVDRQRLSKYQYVRSSNFIVEQFSPTPFDEIRIKRWFGGFGGTPHLATLDHQSRGIRGSTGSPEEQEIKELNFFSSPVGGSRKPFSKELTLRWLASS